MPLLLPDTKEGAVVLAACGLDDADLDPLGDVSSDKVVLVRGQWELLGVDRLPVPELYVVDDRVRQAQVHGGVTEDIGVLGEEVHVPVVVLLSYRLAHGLPYGRPLLSGHRVSTWQRSSCRWLESSVLGPLLEDDCRHLACQRRPVPHGVVVRRPHYFAPGQVYGLVRGVGQEQVAEPLAVGAGVDGHAHNVADKWRVGSH